MIISPAVKIPDISTGYGRYIIENKTDDFDDRALDAILRRGKTQIPLEIAEKRACVRSLMRVLNEKENDKQLSFASPVKKASIPSMCSSCNWGLAAGSVRDAYSEAFGLTEKFDGIAG